MFEFYNNFIIYLTNSLWRPHTNYAVSNNREMRYVKADPPCGPHLHMLDTCTFYNCHCISVVLLQKSHRGPFPLEIARSIDEVKPSFLVGRENIARSVTVTIPITLSLESTIGSLQILFFNIISTAFLTVAGCAVISGSEAKLSS